MSIICKWICWILGSAAAIGAVILSFPVGPPAPSAEAIQLSFPVLAETKPGTDGNPVYPEKLLAADGKLIRITGFATPLNDPRDYSELSLTQGSAGGCYFCAPPSMNGVVFVRRAGNESIFIHGPVTFEGTLDLQLQRNPGDSPKEFLFCVLQAKVVRGK